MKLVSMVDYVLDVPVLGMEAQSINMQGSNRYQKCIRYAKFLKQPLELWMFVPCDEDGDVLEIDTEHKEDPLSWSPEEIKEYQQAKERCLFEGLRIEKDMYHATKRTFYFICDKRIALLLDFYSGEKEFKFDLLHDFKTIEDLVKLDLELTLTAIKQLQS